MKEDAWASNTGQINCTDVRRGLASLARHAEGHYSAPHCIGAIERKPGYGDHSKFYRVSLAGLDEKRLKNWFEG